jgi:hypothetical protein
MMMMKMMTTMMSVEQLLEQELSGEIEVFGGKLLLSNFYHNKSHVS